MDQAFGRLSPMLEVPLELVNRCRVQRRLQFLADDRLVGIVDAVERVWGSIPETAHPSRGLAEQRPAPAAHRLDGAGVTRQTSICQPLTLGSVQTGDVGYWHPGQ